MPLGTAHNWQTAPRLDAAVRIDLPLFGVAAIGIVALECVTLHASKRELGVVLDGDRLQPPLAAHVAERQLRIAGSLRKPGLQGRQLSLLFVDARGRGPHLLPLIPSIEGRQYVLQ